MLPWCAKAGMLLWLSVSWWLTVYRRDLNHALLIIAMWLAFLCSFVTTRSGLGGDDSPSAYTAVELSMLWMGSFGLAGMQAYGWPKSSLVLVLTYAFADPSTTCWLAFRFVYLLVMTFVMGFDILDFAYFLVELWL